MPDLTTHDMAAKLLADRIARSGPEAQRLSDPIADTPMMVTLDELRPYDLNPRVARNPRHEDIKASIRERGLDAPPAITRRPGEPHFIKFLLSFEFWTSLDVGRRRWTDRMVEPRSAERPFQPVASRLTYP